MDFIVIDTETGGLDPNSASVLDLCAAVVEASEIGVKSKSIFSTKIKPNLPVNKKAAEVNGYNHKDWEDAPTSYEAMSAFLAWLNNVISENQWPKPIWTGSNPNFDIKFIKSELRYNDLFFPDHLFLYKTFDIGSLAMPLSWRGIIPGTGLQHIRKWCGLEGEQKHTAHGDVLDVIEIMKVFNHIFELAEF